MHGLHESLLDKQLLTNVIIPFRWIIGYLRICSMRSYFFIHDMIDSNMYLFIWRWKWRLIRARLKFSDGFSQDTPWYRSEKGSLVFFPIFCLFIFLTSSLKLSERFSNMRDEIYRGEKQKFHQGFCFILSIW